MSIKYIYFFLIIVSLTSNAQSFPESNEFKIHERFIDIDTISLDLEIRPFEKSVSGKAGISFLKLQSKVDSFFIHAVNFDFNSVLLNGNEIKYKYIPKGGLWIYPSSSSLLSDNNILEIEYKVNPKKGMFFVGWDDSTNRMNKQIWTQGQGIDNRHWFPSYDLQDEKAIFNIKVTFPKQYNLLSNGKLISKITDSINTVWNYKTLHPMSSYLVMIAGGEYKYIESINNNIDFQYWNYSDKESWNAPTYYKTEDIMSFLENEIGVEYPWSKYAQIPVSDFKHGAMENTGATVFSDAYNCNDSSFVDQNYISVNAHEMAHQWFGNAITCTSSKHHWLHEGFATYYQLLAIKEFLGEDDFIWEKKLYKDRIFEVSKRNSLALTNPKAGTERFYYKGAFVLMMLEQHVGEVNFRKVIKKFIQDNIYGVVETDDLLKSFENTLEVDLVDFFDQWVYNYGEPEIKINYFEIGDRSGIEFKQLKKVFNIDIPIIIESKKGFIESSFNLTSAIDTMFFNNNISYFEIDPSIESLGYYNVSKPIDFWKTQVLKGKTSYSRAEAVKEILGLSVEEKLDVYLKIDLKDESYHVISEVYSQIKYYELLKAVKFKNRILVIDNIDLNKTIVSQADKINIDQQKYFENYLNTKSYELTASTLNLLCKSFPEKTNEYLEKTKKITGATIPYVKMSWLKNAIVYGDYSNYEKREFADQLVDYTSNSFEFNTRLIALSNILEVQYFSKQLMLNLINGSTSFNHHLVGPCRRVLKGLISNDSFRKEIESIFIQEKLTKSEKDFLTKLLE